LPSSLKALALLAALLTAAASFAESREGQDSFYIWKRAWTAPVKEAVEAEKGAKELFFLAGEFDAKEGVRSFFPVNPDWNALKRSGVRATPVYRAKASLASDASLAEAIAESWKACAKEAAASGLRLNSLQIDLDCPESKLEDYARLLSALKRLLPEGAELSATALPCHLARKAFASVAKETAFYVLQVHGLDFPKSLSEKAELLPLPQAKEALKRALELGRPFLLALPCYAYQARYSKRDGHLLFLSAEDPPPPDASTETRLVEPKLQELAELVQETRALPETPFKGIVWFRLPVKGERLCLDRAALTLLQEGKAPGKILKCLWTKTADGQIIFSIENSAALGAGAIEISLHWPSGVNCDYDFLNGFESAGDRVPGLPPGKITGFAPPPGVRTAAAWFRFAAPFPEPLVELREK